MNLILYLDRNLGSDGGQWRQCMAECPMAEWLFSVVVRQNKNTSETRRAAEGLNIAVLRSPRSGLSSDTNNEKGFPGIRH